MFESYYIQFLISLKTTNLHDVRFQNRVSNHNSRSSTNFGWSQNLTDLHFCQKLAPGLVHESLKFLKIRTTGGVLMIGLFLAPNAYFKSRTILHLEKNIYYPSSIPLNKYVPLKNFWLFCYCYVGCRINTDIGARISDHSGLLKSIGTKIIWSSKELDQIKNGGKFKNKSSDLL